LEEKLRQRRKTNATSQAKAMALNRDLNAAMEADENDYNEAVEGDEEEDPYVDNLLNNVRANVNQTAGDREMQYKV
jgi:formylmethanofuran dehydrogenase subunit E-like metal-binding protein